MMMKDKIKNVKIAYEKFNLETNPQIEKNIFEDILKITKEIREEIDELAKKTMAKINVNEIEKLVYEELESEKRYKSQENLKKGENGFVKGEYETSRGIIIIEESEDARVIKYLLEGIKARNAIIISDIEFDEIDVKHIFLDVIKKALENNGQDKNLINIMPYEECIEDEANVVIVNGKEIQKENSEEAYIYKEDEYFEKEVQKEKERLEKEGIIVNIITGKFEEVVEEINKKRSNKVSIYTRNRKLAYRYINMIHSENVFVNATLLNYNKCKKASSEMYMMKNIIYQL